MFEAPDALGWAYQYWNVEEKDRVFTKVRTQRAKIEGADIIPATQLYTEPYMVKFLVQNSLGATWMGMHPDSRLADGWEYYVRDADRTPVARKPVAEITLLDPAVGSGHFLLEAFDLFWGMYEEEGATHGSRGDRRRDPEQQPVRHRHRRAGRADRPGGALDEGEGAGPEPVGRGRFAGFRDHSWRRTSGSPAATTTSRPSSTSTPRTPRSATPCPRSSRGWRHANELGSLLKVEEIVEAEIAAMRRARSAVRLQHGGRGLEGAE